jgi:hypothetical protein
VNFAVFLNINIADVFAQSVHIALVAIANPLLVVAFDFDLDRSGLSECAGADQRARCHHGGGCEEVLLHN